MVVRTFEQLLAYLDAAKVPHTRDLAHHRIELPRRDPALPGHLQLRWSVLAPCVHLVQPVLDDIPAARLREVALAIALLDHRLELGAFGLDDEQRRVYVRLTIPVFPSDGWNAATLPALARGVMSTAAEVRPALVRVVDGAPGEDIVALHAATRTPASSGADA